MSGIAAGLTLPLPPISGCAAFHSSSISWSGLAWTTDAAHDSINRAVASAELLCLRLIRLPRPGRRWLEGDTQPHAHVSSFLEHPWIVNWNPVENTVAVDVLKVGATGAAGLGEVDLIVIAGLIDEGIGERIERKIVDVLRVEDISGIEEHRHVL